jgi:hypothetical protein
MHARDLAIAATTARSAAGTFKRLIGSHPAARTSLAAVGIDLGKLEAGHLKRRPSLSTNWQLLLLFELAPEAACEVELEQPSEVTSMPAATLDGAAAFDGAGFAELPHPPTNTKRAPAASTAAGFITSL